VNIPTLSAQALVAELDRRLDQEHAVIAFDGDGTLWSGDIAEDVFAYAVANDLLLREPHSELERVAAAFGLETSGTPSVIAKRIFDAYVAQRFPEREVCEVMTWCFAGFTHAEVQALAERVLSAAGLDERLNRSLEPVMHWAERRSVRRIVISASPRPIVESAAARWGIGREHVVASTAALEGERLAPRLESPVPYAETKPVLGRRVVGGARWLASFGDSGFDGDMLLAADVRVAVRPKQSLRERAAAIPGLVTLQEHP
jgi:phosphoserine phosphatase